MCPGHVPGSRSESVTERSTTRAEANDSSSTLLLSVSGTQRLPKPLLGLGYRVPAYPFEQSLQDGFLGLLRLPPLPVVLPRVDALFEGLAQKGLDATPIEVFEAHSLAVPAAVRECSPSCPNRPASATRSIISAGSLETYISRSMASGGMPASTCSS